MATTRSGRRARANMRGAGAACLVALALLATLLQLPGPTVKGETQGAAGADVLFYFTAEDYIWGEAAAGIPSSAVAVSQAAAIDVNRAFIYEGTATGARVEIGGLSPSPGAWNWTLLKWGQDNSWEEWTGAAADLQVMPGGAIAWCPSDLLPPAPDPLSKYPWPMFRSTASRRGESLSPPPLTNLTWWTARINGTVISTPCVANGKIFILNWDANQGNRSSLFCFDEYSGQLEWQKEVPGIDHQVSSPACAEGMVFVGCADGKLRAFDVRDGSDMWTFDSGPAGRPVMSSPAVWRGRLLFTGGDGFLYHLTLDGKLIWKANLGPPDVPVACSPAVLGDNAVICNSSGRVFCLDLKNGSAIWTVDLDGATGATPALSPEGYAFVEALHGKDRGNSTMNLYSLYLKDGVVQWNASYPFSLSSPALAAGGLYFGTDTELVGHHPDRGTKMWGIPYGPIFSSPAVSRGYVYFSTANQSGTIGCARVGGAMEWSLAVNESFISSPVVADGRLFAVTVNGTVLCIGRPPVPFVRATLSAPAKAKYGQKINIKAILNNTGEAPAVFTAILTVNNRTTTTSSAPVELQPGEQRELTFEWTARRDDQVLGLAFNGTNGTSGIARITVTTMSDTCAITTGIVVLACGASLVPLIVRWGGRERR